jgi:hypothetical protein
MSSNSGPKWTNYGLGVVHYKNVMPEISDEIVNDMTSRLLMRKSDCYIPYSLSPFRFPLSSAAAMDPNFQLLLTTVQNSITECLSIYAIEYPQSKQFMKWRGDGHLIIYEQGTCANLHSDNSIDETTQYDGLAGASISASVILSDKCTGGSLGFWGLRTSFPPKKGDVYLFPSNFIGAHYVEPITGGNRVVFVEWFGAAKRTQPTEEVHI